MEGQMFLTVEFEAAVRHLASYLYGRIPRTRVLEFAENLGNQLLMGLHGNDEHIIMVNVGGQCDPLLEKVVELMGFSLEEISSHFPKGLLLYIKPGSVIAELATTGSRKCVYPKEQKASNVDNASKGFLVPMSEAKRSEDGEEYIGSAESPFLKRVYITSADGRIRPFFQLEQKEKLYDVYQMAAFRFGWVKQRMHKGLESGMGNHEFTSPSMLSYMRLFKSLLVILRAKEEYKLQGEKEQRFIGKINPRIGEMIEMSISQVLSLSPLMIWDKEEHIASKKQYKQYIADNPNVWRDGFNVTDESEIEIADL
uniref:Anti_prolifrtn domain-containing protein n=1 Tax=Steinernema glaseri TaxID=37863 RepID=A0A1I7YVF8_9BILA